jgi:bifunctional DNase/RNase
MMVPIEVQGLAVTTTDSAPVVLLREMARPRRWLAITIGTPEARELLAAQTDVTTARPGTIELLGHIIAAFGNRLAAVEVMLLTDGIFHADLVFDDGRRVSARPSDALALALRGKVQISVAPAVLEEAAVEVTVMDGDVRDETTAAVDTELEIEQFRAELDEVAPEDFRDPDPS